MSRLLFAALVPALLGPTAVVAQSTETVAPLGQPLGYVTRTFRKDERFQEDETPGWIFTKGEDCTALSIETAIFTADMWNDDTGIGSGRMPVGLLLELLRTNDAFQPPCDDIVLLNRAIHDDTDEERFFENGEPIDAARFADLVTPGSGRNAQATPDIGPRPDWGKPFGTHVVYTGRTTDQQVTLPVWMAIHGVSCGSLAVQSSIVPQDAWNTLGWSKGNFLPHFAVKAQAPVLLDGREVCDQYRHLSRVVHQETGEERYFRRDQEIGKDQFDAFLASNGTDGRVGGYADLSDLPGGLDPEWGKHLAGRMDPARASYGDRLVASYAYHGIMRAYSDQAARSARCAYPGDGRAELTRTYDGVADRNRLALFYPSSHGAAMRRAFEGRPNPDLRGWIAEGRRIVSADGCRGPKVLVLRENLWRFLAGREALSGDEVTALLARR